MAINPNLIGGYALCALMTGGVPVLACATRTVGRLPRHSRHTTCGVAGLSDLALRRDVNLPRSGRLVIVAESGSARNGRQEMTAPVARHSSSPWFWWNCLVSVPLGGYSSKTGPLSSTAPALSVPERPIWRWEWPCFRRRRWPMCGTPARRAERALSAGFPRLHLGLLSAAS